MDPLTGEVRAEGKKFPTLATAVETNDGLAPPDLLCPDAAEILLDLGPNDIPAMVDWLNLLDQGIVLTGMANSDSHNYGSGTGYPRSYLYVGEENPVASEPTRRRSQPSRTSKW